MSEPTEAPDAADLVDEPEWSASGWLRPRLGLLSWCAAALGLAVLTVVVLAGAIGNADSGTDGAGGTDAAAAAAADTAAAAADARLQQEMAAALSYHEPSTELAGAMQADPAEPGAESPAEPEQPTQPAQPDQPGQPATGARLEVSTGGVAADVNWVGAQGAAQSERAVVAGQGDPWSVELQAASPEELPGAMVMAQLQGAGTVTCRVLWAGQVVSEQTASGAGAAVMCALA